jgi:ABC-type nitrate/sulfonate/bicarbonate transport system substrate-binding protein
MGMKSIRYAGLVALVAFCPLAAACGDDDSAGGDERAVIRFAFAPDPVWDYMNDNDMIVKWEEENNIRIVTSSTWDEFTYFAGGHGDIVSMATQETPVLEAETDIETVTFGKYNYQRVPLLRRAGDPYETLADIPKGSNICVSSPVSNTGFWTIAAKELHDLDYRVGGGDFNLIVNDHFVNPTNLLRGDCEAAAVIPEAAVPQLRDGSIELMYDGKAPFQLYDEFAPASDGENHVMGNNFTATAEWFDANKDLAAAFLELWQSGIEAWEKNQAEIISTYPQHFSVEEDADIEFMQEYMAGDNNWFVDSVYLEEDWIETEVAIWELMKNLDPDNPNYLAADAPTPRFEVIEPPAG